MTRPRTLARAVRGVDGSWWYGLAAAGWCAGPVLGWATGPWSAVGLAVLALVVFLALTYGVIRLAELGA